MRVCLFFLLIAIKSNGQDGFIPGKPALAYWSVGSKSETIIVLHGGPGAQHDYLRPEFDALRKTGKVIYYDQRGCGKSDLAESYAWTDHVNDLKRLIDTISSRGKVILIGSSWGSLLGMVYTYLHPEDVKGLILSGTVSWRGKQMSLNEYKEQNRQWPVTKIEQFRFSEKRIWKSKDGNGKVYPDTITVWKNASISFGSQTQMEPLESLVTAPVFDSLKKIDIPVLVFKGTYTSNKDWGKWDWGHTYSEIFPHGELRMIDFAGHDPWLANPQIFFNECRRFIKKIR